MMTQVRAALRQTPIANRRRERNLSAVACLWIDAEGSRGRGVICDISAAGVFLQPLGAIPSGWLLGTRVRVIFFLAVGRIEHKVDTIAEVRWVGPSRDHGCAGAGLSIVGNAALESYAARPALEELPAEDTGPSLDDLLSGRERVPAFQAA